MRRYTKEGYILWPGIDPTVLSVTRAAITLWPDERASVRSTEKVEEKQARNRRSSDGLSLLRRVAKRPSHSATTAAVSDTEASVRQRTILLYKSNLWFPGMAISGPRARLAHKKLTLR